MKIGILTYTKEFANLGTNMQCYCTLKAIQDTYPNARVELIDYAASTPVRKPYFSNASFHSVKSDCIRIAKYSKFFKEELTFSKDRLITRRVSRALDFIGRQHYDAIYVGSDTVLELKSAMPDGLTPYWLDKSIPGRKFLASASSHNLTVEALSPRQQSLIAQAIESFSLLGVRDDATLRLVARFTGVGDKRLEIVPDPTFTYEIDYSHIERYLDQRHLRFGRPVVCLHLLRDTAWAPRLADYFRKAGFVVASLRPAYYADIVFTDLSPFEQLGLYKYFSLVITYRFHDTIFSLKNLTPVLAFPEHASDVTPHGESKIATLLSAFDVETSNYIPNKAMLTAELLFERYPSAMSRFLEKSGRLGSLLLEHRDRYRAFITRSRALVR